MPHVSRILNDEYYSLFKEEISDVSYELTKRSEAFINVANEIGLPMLPFNCGFFVCVPCKDPVKLMKKLYNYDAYVVVTKTCIRVALCAINEKEAASLPKIILKAMQELGE